MKPAETLTLKDYFGLRQRFRRSVDLERDIYRRDALDGYILTPLGKATTKRILEALRRDGTTRALTLTGPYGAGKSAFALFVASLLGNMAANGTKEAIDLLGRSERELANRLRALHRNGPLGFCRITISGTRSPLMPAICRAARQAIQEYFGRGPVSKRLLSELDDVERAIRSRLEAETALCTFLQHLAAAAMRVVGLGVLVVIDELGKFLEFAADGSKQHSDVFVLQRLAEAAARSGDAPIMLITTLHQAFERYATALPTTSREEWAKVQGRFDDVAFLDSPIQLLGLAAKAITRTKVERDVVYQRYDDVVKRATNLGIVEPAQRTVFQEALPLHPTVAALLPTVFRSALAQHERSLFTFLTSNYEGGFAAFLEETRADNTVPACYRLDRLYDFLHSTLGPALYANANGKRWAEIDQILSRIPSSETPVASRIVKCIGLFGLFGNRQLRASRDLLVFALESDQASSGDIRATLDRLLQTSLVVHRRHSDAFALWEGSDVDLERCFRSAHRAIGVDASLVAVLEGRGATRPLVARRHFIESGTLRYFDVRFVLSSDLESIALEELGTADGRIIYLLPADGQGRTQLVAQAKATSKSAPAVVIAVAPHIDGVVSAATEFRAWEEVRQTVPDLAGDAVARKELAARIEEADLRLDRAIDGAFGFSEGTSGSTCVWIHAGQQQDWKSPRAVSRALSALCDQLYSSAPLIRNELVNRRALSSAAASARRSLLNAMLSKGDQPRLGLEGYPPEVSMYTSILERGGLHATRKGVTSFGPPAKADPLRLGPIWTFIDTYFSTEGGRRKIQSLQKDLEARPFGLKEGAFPILLLAWLISLGDEVALFEDGTFVPEVTSATLERLVRAPQDFEVGRFRIDGARTRTLRDLARLLPEVGEDARPLEIVRGLCRRAGQLPPYARSTKRISARARSVRDALLQARDPLMLLFVDLPQAVDLPLGPGGTASAHDDEFAARVATALAEMSDAYPRLLKELEHQVSDALDLGPSSSAARTELSDRAKIVESFAYEPKLRSFVLRAADGTLTVDAWLESLATLLSGRPPAHWTDSDVSRFEIGLADVARLFARADDLALDSSAPPASDTGVVELLRVSVAPAGHAESRRLVRVRESDRDLASKAEAAVEAVLVSLCPQRPDLQIAVLGKTLHGLLGHSERNLNTSDKVSGKDGE